MVTVRSTHFWRFVACLAGTLLLLLGAAYTLRRRPILLHVFADTGCACGEYHDEVTGLIVRNPFRDPLIWHAPIALGIPAASHVFTLAPPT